MARRTGLQVSSDWTLSDMHAGRRAEASTASMTQLLMRAPSCQVGILQPVSCPVQNEYEFRRRFRINRSVKVSYFLQ